MRVTDPYAVKQLVAAAQQLHASRLHERFSDAQCFLIRTPKLQDPAVAVLMGFGRQVFGLNLFLGPESAASYQAMYASGGGASGARLMRNTRMLGYEMANARDLSHDARRWLKKAKARPTGNASYPDPMCLEPGKVPRVVLKDRETRLLLHVVRGILTAADDPAFEPWGIGAGGRVLCLELDGDTDNPTFAVFSTTIAKDGEDTRSTADSTGPGAMVISPRFDLSGLESSGDNWLVALMPVPGSVEGDDRQPFMLAVCSEQRNNLWPSLVMGADPADAVEALSRVMRSEHERPGGQDMAALGGTQPPPVGLPARIVLDTPDLHRAACDAFGPLGVECCDGSHDPGLQAMLDKLDGLFDHDFFGEDDRFPDLLDLPDPTLVPAADNLEGWKQVDGWLKEMIHDGFDHDHRFHGKRALKRYFGPDSDPQNLFAKFRRFMIVDSYAHWFAISYRSARNRPTLAEQWLDDPEAPEAFKQLLNGAIATGPSLYRVEEADEDTGKITLADLFTGDITIATDFALSTGLEPGWVLPAKLVPVGDFHFYFPAGPMINDLQIGTVLDSFKQRRIDPSPEFFRRRPHVLGWLWDVISRSGRQQLDVRNTDGHQLVPHEADFACPDRHALERFLADQPDWEPDGEADEAWVWFRQDTVAPPDIGEGTYLFETRIENQDGLITCLGQLELGDDEFTLHTNSRERLDTARTILERVPGVSLRRVQAHDPGNLSAEEPQTHEAEPTPIDKEQAQAVRDYLTEYYRRWLDEPVPLLDGLTPRQAAASPQLRSQLAAMVRAMPDPTSVGHPDITINAPRDMLLAELGLA